MRNKKLINEVEKKIEKFRKGGESYYECVSEFQELAYEISNGNYYGKFNDLFLEQIEGEPYTDLDLRKAMYKIIKHAPRSVNNGEHSYYVHKTIDGVLYVVQGALRISNTHISDIHLSISSGGTGGYHEYPSDQYKNLFAQM